MPLPQDFSTWEHLQSLLLSVQNRIVREEFSDLGDEWDEDITQPRGSLRVGCTLRDSDSAIETLIKILFFYLVLRKAKDFQPSIYGIPVTDYDETVIYRPQVRLYYMQDLASVPDARTPLRAQISFRLTDETSQTMTEAKAVSLANAIKNEIASAGGHRWSRGKVQANYRDLAEGYDFKLLALSESEAREVIAKVMGIRNKAPDWEKLSITNSNASYPANPGNAIIYGKNRPKPLRRRTAIVRFTHATLSVHGLPNDITLVDRMGIARDPLVKL